MLPAVQQKLSDLFIYLEVKQRLVLCCFTLLAIINAYTMRLCLDFSLSRIVAECDEVKYSLSSGGAALNPKSLPNWRFELAMRLNKTEFLDKNRLKAGKDQVEGKVPRASQTNRRRRSSRESATKIPSSEGISCAELWSRQTQSLVVVAFYAGYMITHIPGGLLAERYGGKWVLGVAILTSAVLTLLTPAAVRCGGPYALVGVRVLVGLCEGPCFPAVCALLAQWVPEQERGLLASCVLSGGEIGITMVQLVSGLVMAEQDWPVAFYLVGGGAVIWFLGFTLICYSTPDHCPYIQSEERDYIKCHTSASLLLIASRERVVRDDPDAGEEPEENANRQRADGEEPTEANPPPTPWKSMLTSKPLWALVSASMQHDWSKQELPKELQMALEEVRSRNSDLWENLAATLAVTAPHIGNWVASLTTGRLSDFLIAQEILTRTQTRRLMSWLVFVCGAMYMLQMEVKGAEIWSIMAMGAYYASVKLLPLDMSPNYAGTLTGISGGLGALPGLLMPYLEQLEADYAVVGSVRAALWIIGASYISGDVQAFNEPQ